MASDELIVAVKDRVGILTLNRPEKRNALGPDMEQQLADTLKAFARDPEVGAIVVTGAGKGFCAGGDVNAMKARNENGEDTLEQQIDALRERHEVPWLLHRFQKSPSPR